MKKFLAFLLVLVFAGQVASQVEAPAVQFDRIRRTVNLTRTQELALGVSIEIANNFSVNSNLATAAAALRPTMSDEDKAFLDVILESSLRISGFAPGVINTMGNGVTSMGQKIDAADSKAAEGNWIRATDLAIEAKLSQAGVRALADVLAEYNSQLYWYNEYLELLWLTYSVENQAEQQLDP